MSVVIARRCHVGGRVQGVFYRASARRRALELGVTGYAKNLPDGRVEVLACGDATAVSTFCEWLHQGPPSAHVTEVAVAEVDLEMLGGVPHDFRTG
jgi:acylphosphatase